MISSSVSLEMFLKEFVEGSATEHINLSKVKLPATLVYKEEDEPYYYLAETNELLSSLLSNNADELSKLVDFKLDGADIYYRNEYSTDPKLKNSIYLLYELLNLAIANVQFVTDKNNSCLRENQELVTQIKKNTSDIKKFVSKRCKEFENQSKEIIVKIIQNSK